MDNGRPFSFKRSEPTGRPSSSAPRERAAQPAVNSKPTDSDFDSHLLTLSQSEPAKQAAKQKPSREAPKKPAKKSGGPGIIKWLIGIAVLALLAVGGYFLIQPNSQPSLVDKSSYQAVTTTDGQIYFGTIAAENNQFITVKKAYFLEADNSSTSDKAEDLGKLIKLSNKLYSPTDDIRIAWQQIVSVEKLDPSGQVAKLLDENSIY